MAGRTLGIVLRSSTIALAFAQHGASPAQAQLTDQCVVSALNRAAPVESDGTWVLPNVPANFGQVRVRATCVDGQTVRSGESELINVPVGGVIRVPDISFAVPSSIPFSITVSSPAEVLTAPGQAVQLTVIALYPDGSSAEVSTAVAGTSYTVSNPALATVDPEGLVTAVTSGTVLVTAMHEGAIDVIRLQVLLAGDSDGDGLPDDWEVAQGLDPNDPVDALLDQDGDGLTTLEEFQSGTDPLAPDTDGDGLLDGREVDETGTDPLLFDTDGDGVSDGLELQAGSNPLDSQSANLAPILAGLTVAPESFTLVFNTLFGEASRLVVVTATLIDGTVLDATAARYGTSYQSSDLTVASLGAEAGRVFAGADGTATITASIGAFAAASLVRVETFSPEPLSFIALPGSPNAVAVSEGHAYVACGSGGLQVVDVADPEAPQRVGSLVVAGTAWEVAVEGDTAYVAAGAGGLAVIDVSAPAAPALLATAPTPSPALDVAVAGGRAYVVDGTGLRVIDVSDPAAPLPLAGLRLAGRPRGVAVEGDLAVIAADSGGVHVVDVSDPGAPRLLGTTATRPNRTSNASSVALRERTVYVADGAHTRGGLKIVDVTVPSTPVVVGASSDDFGLNEVAVEGRFVFAADYFFVNAVPIFNAALRPPAFVSRIDFSLLSPPRDDEGLGLAVADGLVYLAGDRFRFFRFGANGDGGLFIGRYLRAEEEPAAPRAPLVELISPPDGSVVRERSFLTVRAEASDDVRVGRVEFTVEGELVATDPAAPYEAIVPVPVGAASLQLGATAYDSAGNSAAAEPLELAVVPDNRPAVRLLAPAGGQRALEGRIVVAAAEATDDVAVGRVEFLVDGAPGATAFEAPYRVELAVPAAASFTVSAVAYDNVGQSDTSEEVVVPVDPDAPPAVAILAPLDGETVVEAAVVWVTVGAADDYGLGAVGVFVDGELAASRGTPPFEFPVRLPAGTGSVTLTAQARDDLGQTSSAGVVLTVIADPLTSAEGRVVDPGGGGVAGAAVTCEGIATTSGIGGQFTATGVPTTAGRIDCAAEAMVAGEILTGATEPVPPTLGGVTEVGALVVLPQLLYAGAGDGSGSSPPGRLLVYDAAADRFLPWSAPFPPAGLSGLAFDAAGGLWATTLEAGFIPDLRAGGPRRTAAREVSGLAGPGESQLLQLDPDTGEVLAAAGLVVDSAGSTVSVEDLAYDPASRRLYGVDAEPFGGTSVFSIDLATGVAAPLVDGFSLSSAAIAPGTEGVLFLLGGDDEEPGALTLWAIDPLDGQVVVSAPIQGTVEGAIGGLLAEAGGGTLLVAAGRTLYRLDLDNLTLTEVSTPEGTHTGELIALARRPLVASPVVTEVVGRVLDNGDAPVDDVPVATIGAAGASDAAGAFALPNVVVRTGRLRVVAESLGEIKFSAAVPPVAGGTTDVGAVRVGPRACAGGQLVYTDFDPSHPCASGPVSGVVAVSALSEDEEEWLPVGTLTPQADGSICADLRRGGTFLVHQDAVACACGEVGFCDAVIELSDPNAAGRCADPAPLCAELGVVTLTCFVFCG